MQCRKQKKTIQYTNELSNFDINKIPIEQQICLLKAPDSVKEKAMIKLKEVKAKSEDSGTKARQYLDGLLKIPFNVYKREPILNIMNKIRTQFKDIYLKYNIEKSYPNILNKEKYTNMEVLKYIKIIQGDSVTNSKPFQLEKIKEYLSYNELTIKEIAYKLNYNSISHLSNHFKKETGYSPSSFKINNLHREGFNIK